MSEIIVLDTHIWLWFINSNLDKFPSHRRSSNRSCELSLVFLQYLAMRSLWLIVAVESELSSTPAEWFQGALTTAGIEIFPVTEVIAARAVDLSPVHKDHE